MCLDRDAALALEVHRVQHLVDGLLRVHGAGEGQEPVGQRRLAVVDVRDDREVTDAGQRHQLSVAGLRGSRVPSGDDGAGLDGDRPDPSPRARPPGPPRPRSADQHRRTAPSPTVTRSQSTERADSWPRADAAPRTEHRARTDERAGGHLHATAHYRGRLDARAGVDAGTVAEPAAARAVAGGIQRAATLPSSRSSCAARYAAGLPMSRQYGSAPAEARRPVGHERGEQLALDRHRTVARNAREERRRRSRRSRALIVSVVRSSSAGGFSRNASMRPSSAHSTRPNARGSGTRMSKIVIRGSALVVEAAHGAKVRVGEHVAVEDEHRPAREVDGVAHAAARAPRLVLDRVAQVRAEESIRPRAPA